MAFWEDTLKYLYLPRLKDRNVFAQAIQKGAASRDFFGTAYGQHDGKFDGFQFGQGGVQLDDTLLLIEQKAAVEYEASQNKAADTPSDGTGDEGKREGTSSTASEGARSTTASTTEGGAGVTAGPHSFHGTVEVAPATAKMRLVQIADEIVSVLVSDPNASVKVMVEISAEFPNGAKDSIKRAVSENARSLGLKGVDWE
jgi:hypothetical protein